MNNSGSLLKLLGIIFKWWIFFLVFINVLSYLPHYPMHFLSWLNYSIYFLLGVLSFYVSRRDSYMGDVFLQFAIAFWAVTATILVYFVGEGRIFGSEILFYNLFFYSRLGSFALLTLSVFYLTMRYIFWRAPKWIIYGISLLIVILLESDLILGVLGDSGYSLKVANLGLFKHLARMDIVSIIGLLTYSSILFFKDRPNGAFVNLYVVGLLISFSFDIFDLMVSLHRIEVYGIDQYFAIFCILTLAAALFLRLVALHSNGFVLREQFIFDKKYAIRTPIVMKESQFPGIVKQLKMTFQNQDILIQTVLGTIFVLISGFAQSLWVTGKMILTVVMLAIVWNVYNYIFRHRISKGQILNQRFINEKNR